MSIWSVLGIKETKDKDELKKAYRRMLAKTNPEDDPEGFMELRSAYEEALKLADKDDEPEESQDELNAKFEEIYKDFFKRIDEKEWKKLFDEDEFVALDTAEDSFDKLIRFLMSNFYLPKNVWELICTTFEIREQRKELKTKYPDDFLEYMINNATYDDVIDYTMFDGNEDDFDDYIELYYRLDSASRKRDLEEQQALLEKIEALDAYHPYIEIAKIRNAIQEQSRLDYEIACYLEAKENGEEVEKELDVDAINAEKEIRIEELRQTANDLFSEFSDNINIINCCGDIAMYKEDFEEAKFYYDKSLEIEPDSYIVKGKQAELYYYLGEYEKSRDAYMDLLKINHYDNNVRAGMMRANQGLIELHKKEIEEDPTNNKARLEMAWSYYQSYQFEDAIKTLDEFSPNEEQIFEYNNLKGRNYLCVDELEKALECFEIWKSEIEKLLEDDDSQDVLDKKKRYEYVNFLIGDCYLKLGKYDEARKYFDTALKKEHDEIILSYEAYCELEYKSNNMEACLDACERLLERDSRSYIGYDYMSRAYYELGYVNETINACERAMSIYPYVSFPYELEIKVMLRLKNYETAEKIMQRFRSYEIESDRMDFTQARIFDEQGETEAAIEALVELAKNMDVQNSDMDDPSDVFYRLGLLYDSKEEYEGALRAFETALEINPNRDQINGRIGLIYRDRDDYEKALEYFDKELEIEDSGYYRTQRAIIHKHYDNFELAEVDFKQAIKLDGENSFCNSRLGLLCEQDGRYEEALVYYDKAKKYLDENIQNYDKRISYIIKNEARTLQCLNRFDECYKIYNEYIEKYGIDADLAYDYAELLERMDRTEEALALITNCINSLPYDDDLQLLIRHMIGIAGDEGYLDKASEAFALAIEKKPDDFYAYSSMGRVLRDCGKYQEAREMYEKANELSNGGRTYYNEIVELIYLSELEDKTADLENILKQSEMSEDMLDNPYNALKQVRKYRVLKNYDEAIRLINVALKQRKCFACAYSCCHEAYFEKGLVYEAMGDYEKAKVCYREAIRICGHTGLYEEKLKEIEEK